MDFINYLKGEIQTEEHSERIHEHDQGNEEHIAGIEERIGLKINFRFLMDAIKSKDCCDTLTAKLIQLLKGEHH